MLPWIGLHRETLVKVQCCTMTVKVGIRTSCSNATTRLFLVNDDVEALKSLPPHIARQQDSMKAVVFDGFGPPDVLDGAFCPFSLSCDCIHVY